MKISLPKRIIAELIFVAVGITASLVALDSLGNLPEVSTSSSENIKNVKQIMDPLRVFSGCGFIAILLFIVNICTGKRSYWALRLLLIVFFLLLGSMIGNYLVAERPGL